MNRRDKAYMMFGYVMGAVTATTLTLTAVELFSHYEATTATYEKQIENHCISCHIKPETKEMKYASIDNKF
jgi:hypothetical protein